MCYIGYFSRVRKNKKTDTVSVRKMIKAVNNDCTTKYTQEEPALHQRMANALVNQAKQGEVRKEDVKQLRLQ